ncbi:MAG: bifunctional 2-polyprenyl-6-hydroxyphenol methylase/3-demethylubiquinol 3-O-methyltransferase UbiG [Gammaproteobacteria bacterium]|nr:bifunctional 2-polyprenyl-6-hydroxyphenol methylase/3-demethylubiquinol 3-O-methyltransferase UbiG [Gammaproteobacteria bacterium]MCK5262262.1 bifunctional 2-polyprenyl-6-hydroxyphenol methylase/3-demethylubiquinol 3-O-methyltransferase UbiG [Gammaproteobacteria bacterium]
MNTAHTEHNVDPAEIQKFEELASRWWDKSGEFKPLHDINPIRLNFINTNSPLSGKKALDVGCGGGILTESLARAGADTTGIDMGKAPLSIAKLHAMEEDLDIEYQQITVEAHAAEQAGSYDVVTCMEMLEHVPDPASIVNACTQLVKPGGSVYFSTVNRNAKAYLLAILGAEYVMKMLPKGTHDYSKFIRPSELDIWARQAGLELMGIEGVSYNPLTGMFRKSNDVDVNYMVHYQRPAE